MADELGQLIAGLVEAPAPPLAADLAADRGSEAAEEVSDPG